MRVWLVVHFMVGCKEGGMVGFMVGYVEGCLVDCVESVRLTYGRFNGSWDSLNGRFYNKPRRLDVWLPVR